MSCVEQFEVSCVLLFWGFEESSDDQRIRADLSGSHHVAVDNSSFTCLHRWLSESWKKPKEHWIWVIKDSWLSANKHGSFNYLVNTFVLNDESHFSIWKHPVLHISVSSVSESLYFWQWKCSKCCFSCGKKIRNQVYTYISNQNQISLEAFFRPINMKYHGQIKCTFWEPQTRDCGWHDI